MNQFSRNGRNINPATVLIAATLLMLCSVALISRIQKLNTDKEWDVLLFVQHWPNSVCIEWEEEKHGNCSLPRQKGHWTIHGIWPTKLGTVGPLFCDKSQKFNITSLDDIKNNLDEYWTDIEIGQGHKPNSFWKHEWLKHGTCATSLANLDSEIKYFEQGLKWYKEFNMIDILNVKGVHPKKIGNGYSVEELSDAVHVAIGKNPYIHCVHDKKTGLPFLSEIRLCFDKNLSLVDCDGVKLKRTSIRSSNLKSVLTSCPQNKPIIMYPKDIPSLNRIPPPIFNQPYLVNLYNILSFLNWFTT